jgi:hypothetical protein
VCESKYTIRRRRVSATIGSRPGVVKNRKRGQIVFTDVAYSDMES